MLRRHAKKRKAVNVTALNISVSIQNDRSVDEIVQSITTRRKRELKNSSQSIYR